MTNPSAFPAPENFATLGMKLRDYFAAKAMQAMIEVYPDSSKANNEWIPSTEYVAISKESYAIADAMLAEREK